MQLFHLAPAGYIILDIEGSIEEVNAMTLELMGKIKPSLLHQKFEDLICDESKKVFRAFLDTLKTKKQKHSCEVYIKEEDEGHFFRLDGLLDHHLDGGLKYLIILSDITSLVKTQKELTEMRERLEMALEASSMGIFTVDLENMQLFLDDFCHAILKIDRSSFGTTIEHFLSLVHPSDKNHFVQNFIQGLKTDKEVSLDFRVQVGTDEVKVLSVKGHGVKSKEKKYFAGFLMDVTERKRLEWEADNLQINQQKAILEAVLTAQEKERSNIGRALHDSVCQLLYGIRLNIQSLRLPKNEHYANLNFLIDEAIREIRNISYELTPSVLTDFGFSSGIKEIGQRISNPTFKIHTSIDGSFDLLDHEIQLSVFRIIQELLNNCLKYSKATRVSVTAEHVNDEYIIQVTDNGIGFDPAIENANKNGSGLRGIRNRLFLINGDFLLESSSKGTNVTIKFKEALNEMML